MRRRGAGRRWRDAAVIAGFALFLAICVVVAGALTAQPARIKADPPPRASFSTATATPVPACILGDQFAVNGLLTQAVQYYAAAVPTPSPSAAASPAATSAATPSPGASAAAASPGDAANCAVAGLRYVAARKQHAAVLAAQGDAARSEGEDGAAKTFYRHALVADQGNAAAAKGLQLLGAQPDTGFQRAADRLQHTRTTVLAPLGQLLLWLLGAAAGLYLLILLTKAASRVPWPLYRQRRMRQALHTVAIVVTVLGGIALGVGAGLAWVHDAGWPWLAGLGVAAVLVVASWSWYLRLRVDLQLSVNNTAGVADPDKAAYLAGRLAVMGSGGPRGIRMAQQPDVISLPATALSVLPGGNYLTAALQVLSATSVASPWQATVSMINADVVSVLVQRYGKSVTTVVADRRQLWFPDADPASICDIGDSGLLAMAAAVILRTLADAHDELEQGLAGATRWESIAGQVLAGDVAAAHPEAQRALLARAVDVDAGNFAARVAYLCLTEGTAADGAGQRKFAESMSQVDSAIHGPVRDEPVCLRVLFNLAAAWLNAFLFERAEGKENTGAWPAAERCTRALRERLKPGSPTMEWEPFWLEMRQRTEWLWLGVQATDPEGGQASPVARAPGSGTIRCGEEAAWTAGVGPAARQYYDCACTRAARRDYAPALDALELAVVDPELMMGARTDASFAELRDPDKVRAPGQACDPGNLHLPLATEVVRFYQIVGQPGPGRFTALAPFAKYDDALQAVGVRTELDLLRLTDHAWKRHRVAHELGVPELVLQRWRGIADLAARDPDAKRDSRRRLAYLDMLLAVGVDSPAELSRRAGALDELINALRTHPVWCAAPPPDRQTLAAWAAS